MDTPRNRTAHALLIGIDAYPHLPPEKQLAGCVNDAELLARTLTTRFGFSDENLTLLRDAQATRRGIVAAMDALVERVGPDDVVVIHYSGHGVRVTDLHGDEPSGLDSALVPHDGVLGENPTRVVLDDEIQLWLARLAETTRFVTLIFDGCHAGGTARDVFGEAARQVEPDLRPAAEIEFDLIGSPLAAAARNLPEAAKGRSGWVQLSDSYVLLAGCREDELAFEHAVREDGRTVRYGALSYFLNRELVRAPPGSSYREVFDRARQQVTRTHPRQRPQIEGRSDRPLFEGRAVDPLRFVAVTGRRGDQIRLDAGAAHGVTTGSSWAIYPQGTRRTDDPGTARLGLARVRTVGAVQATAELIEGADDDAVAAGCHAVEDAPGPDLDPLVVELVAVRDEDRAQLEALERALRDEPLLRRAGDDASDGAADVRVYLLPPRDVVTAGRGPVPQLGALGAATWAAVDRSGDLATPAHAADEPGVIDLLHDNLVTLARCRTVTQLRNPDAGDPLNGKVTLRLRRQAADGRWHDVLPEPDGGDIELHDGDRIAFAVTNHAARPVWISLIDVGLSGRVSLIYPNQRPSVKLAPGVTMTLGENDAERLTAQLPAGHPRDRGLETVKLFASARQTDFSWLQREGVRAAEGAAEAERSGTPLERLFASSYRGGAPRDPVARQPASEAWWVEDLAFVLTSGG